MADFDSALLWAIIGRVRPIPEGDAKPTHRWDHRRVVITAKDYQAAHEASVDALLKHWSNKPHEAEIYAVRPAGIEDLQSFKWDEDPAYRVLVTGCP